MGETPHRPASGNNPPTRMSPLSFRHHAETSGLHPDRSLCAYCGVKKRGHVCRWAWPRKSTARSAGGAQPHSGSGSGRIQLSELVPPVPEVAEPAPAPRVEVGWLSEGPHVGERVLRRLKGHGYVHAVVRLYLPAGDAEDEPAFWHIEHADGDEEDLVRSIHISHATRSAALCIAFSGRTCPRATGAVLILPSPTLA